MTAINSVEQRTFNNTKLNTHKAWKQSKVIYPIINSQFWKTEHFRRQGGGGVGHESFWWTTHKRCSANIAGYSENRRVHFARKCAPSPNKTEPNTTTKYIRSVYVTKHNKSEGKKINNRILVQNPYFTKQETQAQRLSSFLMSDWSQQGKQTKADQ